ncbi:hypothetical protein BSKO_01025 [Bryopsis sp. KO-2023]|nr:hypothetical protein BSKO_01025 [Bryopsis sp. KO-2023]
MLRRLLLQGRKLQGAASCAHSSRQLPTTLQWGGHSHTTMFAPTSLQGFRVFSKSTGMSPHSGWQGLVRGSRGMHNSSACGWKDGVADWTRAIHQQALSNHFLWQGPWGPAWNVRGMSWPAERWLIVSTMFRNYGSYVPNFGSLMGGRWATVATITSLNTVGAHVPRMLGLVVAQMASSMSSSDALSRDSIYPWKDMQRIEQNKQLSWCRAWLRRVSRLAINVYRLIWLTVAFSPLVVLSPFAFWLGWGQDFWMSQLRATLERCGPAFIKWGQWAATRKDMFPATLCMELEKLQASAPAHSFAVSDKAIRTAFDMSIADLFIEFDKEPLASGSIGQVHRAVLSDLGAAVTGVPKGTQVAVKVRHPGVDVAFHTDHQLMLGLTSILSCMPGFRHFNLEDTIKQFSGPMAEQVDLCIEAANLRCFNHNFRKDATVTFPEPLFPLVTPDILVETFHQGRTVQEICETEVETENGHQLAEHGTNIFFQMLIDHNLLHADLHPGNILVNFESQSDCPTPRSQPVQKLTNAAHQNNRKQSSWEDGDGEIEGGWVLRALSRVKEVAGQIGLSGKSMPKIVLLDAGMATQLTQEEQKCMLNLFRGVSERDGVATANAVLAFAGSKQSCPNPDAYRDDMVRHFDALSEDADDTLGYESGIDALSHCLELVRQHHVIMPGEVCSVLFSVFVLEGWSSQLNKDHDVMDQIKRTIKRWDKTWKSSTADGIINDWGAGDNRLALA